MEHTTSTLAAELKRQIVGQLPPRPLVGGGFHHFELRASVIAEVSTEVSYAAFEIVLRDLSAECPEWEIELEGSHGSLKATFSR
ncbi:hypothetical protein [Pseudomonas asplenii]|uniref:Uncharacterized protein n=1 Tax=Pseudomonas asplenii TaxID=53407 RepID=A0A1H6PDA7_9PSED|nr:hypothetical protein [Pseudomonas fuscovaginae]SEI23626.1 hypothetical protein SAMN05216581_5243 [Pseudomonas fuscovaginae]